MRTLTALLLAAVTACGGGGSPSPAASPDVSAAQAERLVKAGLLRPADVPGYRREPASSDEPDSGGTCLRDPETVAEGDASYARGGVLVVSDVYVTPRAASAAGFAAYVADDDTMDCLRRALVARLTTSDQTFTARDPARFRVSVRGADASYGYAVALAGTRDDGRKGRLSVLSVGATTGPAIVEVTALGAPDRLPSRARLTALLSRAVARVRAAR